MSGTQTQIKRFLVVGVTTVAIDLVTYRLLLWAGLVVTLAKAIGFITGTVFAYFANKTWTFDRVAGGARRFGLFLAVYGMNLVINVLINAGLLQTIGRSEFGLAVAFLAATGTSATLNFLGMKLLVFRHRDERERTT